MNSLFSFIFLLLLFETNSNGNFEWSFRLKQIHGAADRGPKNASNQNKKIAYNVSETKALADIFRKKIQNLKANSEIELILLVDGSGSVGLRNFVNELKFIQRLISDVEVNSKAFRLGVIVYSANAVIYVDHLSVPDPSTLEKCTLLHFDLPKIAYPGLMTNTKEALEKAEKILTRARKGASKVIFLLTDGFSNVGSPISAAQILKDQDVVIYTFGIKNGNVEELQKIATRPSEEHVYLLESFDEFDGFARRALHKDLTPGIYAPASNSSFCNYICRNPKKNGCCSRDATCSCGLISGHFTCLCPPGYYGSGLIGEGCTRCPEGTYNEGLFPGDVLTCVPCPDKHHVIIEYPATSKAFCLCKNGTVPDGDKCSVVSCPILSPPNNGYFVKKNCSNAVNAACGVRCHMGYTLIGSSVRICQGNGTWTGTSPICQAKHCDSPKAVPNSEVICSNEESQFEMTFTYDGSGKVIKQSATEINKNENLVESDVARTGNRSFRYPVGTTCIYSCLRGHDLIGSRSRGCLPMLKWSGLKPKCKSIKCPSLPELRNGSIKPKKCTHNGVKLNFGEICRFYCDPGYELKGQKMSICAGKHGTWTGNVTSRCIDVEPPTIECPGNFVTKTDDDMYFATVNFTLPKTSDNSGRKPRIWSTPPFEDNYPLRFSIGETDVQIHSEDEAGNREICSFTVKVKDEEKPKVLECRSPPVFFISQFPSGLRNFSWTEPVFDDNSGVPVTVTRTPSNFDFPMGTTAIEYTATDATGNSASCILNITVLDNPCSERPQDANTLWNCSFESSKITVCDVSCPEGFGLTTNTDEDSIRLNCTFFGRKAYWTPNVFKRGLDTFPECSGLVPADEIRSEIIIEDSNELCNNLSASSKELLNKISPDEATVSIFTFCEDDSSEELETNIISAETAGKERPERKNEDKGKEKKSDKMLEMRKIKRGQHQKKANDNLIRRKRVAKKRKKLIIVVTPKGNDTRIEEQFNQMAKNLINATNSIESFYADNKNYNTTRMKTILSCRNGSLSVNNACVKCPKGTFHNVIGSTCDPCPTGYYQEIEGQLECIRCPEGFSTEEIRRWHFNQCKKICPAGTYGTTVTENDLALEPCTSCPVGFYQPERGRNFCEICPRNYTTSKRGSIHSDSCIDASELRDPCYKFNCQNGGQCFLNDNFAYCKCLPGYAGSFCENVVDPCDPEPCHNGGRCHVISSSEYVCYCSAGFEGNHCEHKVNECSSGPCNGQGECVDLLDGFACDCFPGFAGPTCNETTGYCEELQPCLNSGTCVDVNGSYVCHCQDGFSGTHCDVFYDCSSDGCVTDGESTALDVDPCLDVTCGENMKCEVLRNSLPSCACADGFRGLNCSQEINPNVVLRFPKYGVTEYLLANFPEQNFNEISVCVWIQTIDTFNYGTLFSYATREEYNAFTVTDYSGIVLYVSGQYVVTDLRANDGFWHFICVTWQSHDGLWQVYLNGSLFSRGTGLSNNTFIPGGGLLVVGQEQDSYGGGYNEAESFAGRMTNFDVWDRVLRSPEIQNLFENCEPNFGNLITWLRLLQNINGDITEEESTLCKRCNSNLSTHRAQIAYYFFGHKKVAKYTCDEGFVIEFNSPGDSQTQKVNFSFRECLKTGNWHRKEPKCIRISCGSPDYFPDGGISSSSHLYGDKITYYCWEGYSLQGNDTRICLSNGTWSDKAPRCQWQSKGCKKLTAPRHGSMFLHFTGDRSYGTSPLLQGTKVEFECDKGYRIKGRKLLTCTDGGTWDREPPICERITCSYPTELSRFVQSPVKSDSKFNFGEYVTVACPAGEWKTLICGTDGNWNATSNICKNVCHGRPQNIENGFFIQENNEATFYEGETLRVECLEGFQLRGDDVFTCSENGTWIQSQQTFCSKIICEPPSLSPVYQVIYEGDHNYGDKIIFRCAPGYQSPGEIAIRCEANGRYSRIESTCIKISCEVPVLPKGYSVKTYKSTFLYGSKVMVGCPPGKSLINKSKSFIECEAEGKWSSFPECF